MSLITNLPQFPPFRPTPRTIVSTSPQCFGEVLGQTTTAPVSGAWPTANLALFLPFEIESPVIANRIGVNNGGTVSGNFDTGIYALDGTRLVAAGSTAQSGTSTVQEVDLTDTVLPAGNYFLALVLDNTTGTIIRFNVPSTQWMTVGAMQEMASAFPLPSTATFANPSNQYIPSIALSFAGVI